jgi:hypothetical protein
VVGVVMREEGIAREEEEDEGVEREEVCGLL